MIYRFELESEGKVYQRISSESMEELLELMKAARDIFDSKKVKGGKE